MADGDSLKKIRISNELIYVLAVVILSFATAMLAAADMGMSMVVAPAYIVSLKVEYLTHDPRPVLRDQQRTRLPGGFGGRQT